jgi:hypothetical protein
MDKPLPPADALLSLLRFGSASSSNVGFDALRARGLLWFDESSKQMVIAQRGLRIANLLPTETEAVAGLLACDPSIRNAWVRLVAARLREAGQRRDLGDLCQAIETLGTASREVREAIGNASLAPTNFSELERTLFGSGAEQSVNYPKLLRVLGKTAEVISDVSPPKPLQLKTVDPFGPKETWCPGRVLQLPSLSSAQAHTTLVLNGTCDDLHEGEFDAQDNESKALMRWVLFRPWCMLLAQIVFTQEAWEAERIDGRLSLELSDEYLDNPYEPPRIDIVVTGEDGYECVCGSLGELVQRILQRLQISLIARPSDLARMDDFLAPLVRRLLERKVWRFDPRGGGAGRPGFTIDDDFSTSCYRAFGSRYFYRAGSILTAAIRASAEQWAADRQTKSRVLLPANGLPANGANGRE